MANNKVRRGMQVALLATTFAVGYLCGSVTQQRADAQLGEMGAEVMKKAGSSGGMLGSATDLGSAIVDMQKNVDGLQKNLDSFKKVKAALGG